MTEQQILRSDDLGAAALAGSHRGESPSPGAVAQALEHDERLDRFARAVDAPANGVGRSPAGDALRGTWLGHPLHPALTDLPVGFWTSAFVLDLVGGRRARPAAQRLVALGLLSVPVTAASGLADYETIDDPGSRRVGAAHAIGNVGATFCYWSSWRARRRGHHARGVLWGAVGGGLASVTAYLGGHLAFGRSSTDGSTADATATGDPAGAPTEVRGRTLLDLDGASAMLGVPVAQVQAMVGEGLLQPVSPSEPEPRFRDADVLAVKLMGG